MYQLASCFLSKFDVRNNWDDLDEAIRILQHLAYVDPDDVDQESAGPANVSNSLAIALGKRYSHSRDSRDLTDAISIQERLVQRLEAEPDEGIIRPVITLCQLLKTRFNKLGNPEDIDKAISLARGVL